VNPSEECRDSCRAIALCAAGLFAFGTVACTEPLAFADWTIPVSGRTRVVEYADASDADRENNRIELIDDLVLRGAGDEATSFYQPYDVMTDDAGRIYVVDLGDVRIQVFDQAGTYVRTLGGEGSGPGEFRGAAGGWVTILTTMAGDHLVAYDLQQSRISVWNTAGDHLGDHILDEYRLSRLLGGRRNAFVAVTMARSEGGSEEAVIALDLDGTRNTALVSLPRPENLLIGERPISAPSGTPLFAAAPDGTVYASAGDEYQVLAIDPDGEQEWALRVARERPAFTSDDRARVLDRLSMDGTHDVDDSGTNWPARLAAISRLAVDGHGHLYVFDAERPFAETPERVAVDVYAADGERLFTGTMPPISWHDVSGDYVFDLRSNAQTEEREVVRYRLVEPF